MPTYLSRTVAPTLIDLSIPQRDCGRRSYCGRCPTCRRWHDAPATANGANGTANGTATNGTAPDAAAPPNPQGKSDARR